MVAPSVDLLAALRPTQVIVTVAGHRFALIATTAAHWLGAIALDYENLCGIMPGLIHDDDLDLMENLIEDHEDIETRWVNAARVALGRAAGRDWWWALNLSRHALGTWLYTNGMLLRQNVNSQSLSYPDWLDACYTLYWGNAKEEDQVKLDMRLSMPPAGVAIHRSKAATRQMLETFAAD